jgi:hypothetical protein
MRDTCSRNRPQDEQPEIPAHEQELRQRQADQRSPPTGPRQVQGAARGVGVPARYFERRLCPPDEEDADHVDEHDQQHLGHDRSAQAHRRGNGCVEARALARR